MTLLPVCYSLSMLQIPNARIEEWKALKLRMDGYLAALDCARLIHLSNQVERLQSLLLHRYWSHPSQHVLTCTPGAVDGMLSQAGDANAPVRNRAMLLDVLSRKLSNAAHRNGAAEMCLSLLSGEATPLPLHSHARRLLCSDCDAADAEKRSAAITALCFALSASDLAHAAAAARALCRISCPTFEPSSSTVIVFWGKLPDIEQDTRALQALVDALRNTP